MRRRLFSVLAAAAMVALALVLPGASRQASAINSCSGGVCQEWVARYNGPASSDDYPHALALDGWGNVYVTGYSPGSGTGQDYATVKYNAGGVQQWVARYNGAASGDDEATALAVDGSGNVYVTGYSTGSGTGYDYATVMYNSLGAQQWAARYDGPANNTDEAYALAVDGSGNVYVTGWSYGGSGTHTDYATVKYNAAGVQQWVARYNGPASGDDLAHALAVDGSGNVYVTGYSTGSGTGQDYATVKYDAGGVQQWASRYDGPASNSEMPFALAVDGSGNVYVTGTSFGSDTAWDYATVKYNASGVQQWASRYDGPASSTDEAHALAVDGSGNVYITGGSGVAGTDEDYATVKYNSGGAQQWASRYDGPAGDDDQAYAMAVDGSGNVYVTGYSTGSGTGHDIATMKYGADGGQEWVARYDGPASGQDGALALAVDGSGNVYVTGSSYGAGTSADYATVMYSTPVTISHLAGQYKAPGYSPPGDGGQAQNAKLNDPHGLYETADHTLYFADTGNNRIRRIQPRGPAGIITTVAGSATPGYCGDGDLATSACLSLPRDVFVDRDGNIFIADTGNNRIRKVDASTRNISTVAGTGGDGSYSGDGGPATSAQLNSPRGVAVDTAGNIYIADTLNNRIRKVDASTGNISTIAGNGTAAYSGDGGPATSARLNQPHDVYPWGSMYAGTTDLLIADTGNNVIRWLHGPSGVINTLAGTGASGFSGDDEPATSAQLQAPEAVASDASLAVFVADTQNDRIRRVAFGEATISTVAGGGDGSGCAASHTEPYYGCPATDAILNEPAGVATGSLSFSDSGSATLGGVDPVTGEPTGTFSNAAGGCSGGMATIDWAFVVVVLGLILARRQVNGLLMRIGNVAGLSPRPGTTR